MIITRRLYDQARESAAHVCRSEAARGRLSLNEDAQRKLAEVFGTCSLGFRDLFKFELTRWRRRSVSSLSSLQSFQREHLHKLR